MMGYVHFNMLSPRGGLRVGLRVGGRLRTGFKDQPRLINNMKFDFFVDNFVSGLKSSVDHYDDLSCEVFELFYGTGREGEGEGDGHDCDYIDNLSSRKLSLGLHLRSASA